VIPAATAAVTTRTTTAPNRVVTALLVSLQARGQALSLAFNAASNLFLIPAQKLPWSLSGHNCGRVEEDDAGEPVGNRLSDVPG